MKGLLLSLKLRIAGDTVLNFLAIGIPLGVLQFAVLPLMAKDLGSDSYGLALSLIAILNLFPSAFGSVLNNVRLLESDECTDEGSYRALSLVLVGLNAAVMVIASVFYEGVFDFTVFLMLITGTLQMLGGYLSVSYRLTLNYKAIAINGLMLSAGYSVGYGLFLLMGEWSLVYLLGQAFSFLFVLATTSLWRGPIGFGSGFKRISINCSMLLISTVLGRLTSYADRLLIYPLLGGWSTAVYYAASLVGKVLSAIVGPFNGVILSYLARMKSKPDRLFKVFFLSGLALCVVCYAVTMLISEPMLRFLYPQYVDDAMNYIWIVTAAAYVDVLSSLINPFVLKFTPMRNQIIISGVYLIVYVGLSCGLLYFFGLFGFCVGSLVATTSKLVLLLILYRIGSFNQALHAK